MNTNVTIACGPCPRCRRPDTPMRNNFTLYMHKDAMYPHMMCFGPSPEIMFTCLLRSFGLDVRPDCKERQLLDEDPEWAEDRQRANRRRRAVR